MLGFLLAIVSGAAMSIQGVMNTRLSDKIGLWESNAFVQCVACALSLLAWLIMGKGSFKELRNVQPPYLLGGALGLVITVTVMSAIHLLSPTVATSVILIAQLIVAAVIDGFGLMGSEKVAFSFNEIAGVLLMIGGVILFKWKAG